MRFVLLSTYLVHSNNVSIHISVIKTVNKIVLKYNCKIAVVIYLKLILFVLCQNKYYVYEMRVSY